ncbi:hypothetical protein HPB50_011740 [Hyalomma asiaticum]|uniref:Uncharacterized protein n=1 Tax=Hyalomma asiaticum TaxID=266040 RepID=A0ACB7SH08_HYAAI|nr:hypothetical protein HPB50_011740 [Hyalomma asiaticum]
MEERFEQLTEEEKARNGHSGHLLFVYSEDPQPPRPCKGDRLLPRLDVNHAKVTELDMDTFRLPVSKIKKGLLEGVNLDVYFPGFPTLKHLHYTGCLKKESIKVFQALTRNESMVITINNNDERTLTEISTELLGKSVYVYWPHLLEALVVAVSSRDERHSLEMHKHAKNYENISIFKLASTDQEVFDMQVSGIKERYLGRYGVNVGDVNILVFCKTLTGRKYTCTSKGRITLEKQWAELSVPFALQSIVKVADAKPATKAGRILVKFTVPVEPNLDGIIRNERVADAKPATKAGRILVKFTVPVEPNLDGIIRNERIPGYSKRTNDSWLYSTKCLQVLKDYLGRYLDFVQRILPFLGQDKIAVEDLYPKGVGKEEVKEVAKWIKEQECTKVPRVKSGAQLLDEGVVQAIEETINRAKDLEPPQEVLLDVHPKHLYRPGLQYGWVPPDPKATYQLFDRVVNVRENVTVPLGHRGTVIGLLPLEDNEPQMCEVVFDEPFAGGLPLRCSDHRGYRISTLFLVNLSYGSRGQRSQQLYQVPARRQHQVDSFTTVPGNKVRTGSAQPRPTHASADSGWQDLSPQRRQGKNRFHHSPNSPFEAQKSSPAPESSGEGTSDFASLWMGLQNAAATPPAQQASASSQHHGTPLSLDDLFRGAKNHEEENSGNPVATSSASILEELVKCTKESMGCEPEHFCIGMDGEPPKKFKAFVILPNGKKFASACMDNQKCALQDAAQQALAFVTKKMPASQLMQPTPIAVQAQRPNLPLPFGNPPPPLSGAGSLGAQFRMPPPCEASLIPDSYVESNRRLMESLNSMPNEQPTAGLSWQMPRMPPPFARAPLYMASSPGKEPYQQRPFFPSPRGVFAPRPAMFLYQQHQTQLHRQPHPDSLLRPQFPARSPHKDRNLPQRGGGRYGDQQSDPCPPRPLLFPEHQLSPSASVFIPTQVMRKQPAPKSTAATASSSSPKKNKATAKATKAVPTVAVPEQKLLDLAPSASTKQQAAKEPEAAAIAAPSSAQQQPSKAKPNQTTNATLSAQPGSQPAASSSKPPARRSRLAVKFDFAPS